MGSICYEYKKEHWEIIEEGNLKENNEIAYNVKVGEWDVKLNYLNNIIKNKLKK